MEAARHDGQAVRARVGVETADGAGHRDAARVVIFPQAIERHGELGAGQRGVAAEAPGQADMVVAALDAGVRVTEIAGDAGADGNWAAGFDQAGGLLDVQLQVGAQPAGSR